MAAVEAGDETSEELDDRVALLFVACDEALAPGARMVLALRVVCGLTIPQTAMHLGTRRYAASGASSAWDSRIDLVVSTLRVSP